VREYWLKSITESEAGPPVTKAVKDACADWKHWRNLTYYKAAYFLSMLKDDLGDKVFFDMLRNWVAANKDREVTTSQFLKHLSSYCEEAARIADQWLMRTTIPEIEVSYKVVSNGDGFKLIGRIILKGDVFVFPLEIVLRGSAQSATLMLKCEQAETTFTRELKFEPIALDVDPNHRLLLNSKVLRGSAHDD
jgi:aminopeptidase N